MDVMRDGGRTGSGTLRGEVDILNKLHKENKEELTAMAHMNKNTLT